MEHRIKERLTLDEVRELDEELAKDGRMKLVKDKEKNSSAVLPLPAG